ncbi:MAG: TonB-dependent receptor, partial [Nitrospirae bacterium]
VEVTGRRPAPPAATAPVAREGREALLETPAPGTGTLLSTLPGVSAVKRGGCGLDPVVRGLKEDRVNVLVDGTRLYGACPSRMDPPTMYVAPWSLESIEVVKGPYSVTLGPGGLGGTVLLKTHTLSGHEGPERAASVGYDTARHGTRVEASAAAGHGPWDFAATAGSQVSGDYNAGDGTTVPADFRALDASLDLGYAAPLGRLGLSLAGHRDAHVDYPALPMEARVAGSYRYALALDRDHRPGRLAGYHAKLYWNRVLHTMDNFDRPAAAKMRMETRSDSNTAGGRVEFDLALGATTLALGGDGYRLSRDANRRMVMAMSGMGRRLKLWPDTVATDAGLFAEVSRPLGGRFTLRAGVRLDTAHTEARAGDGASGLPGQTVRDAFVTVYGPGAADLARTDLEPGGNLRLGYRVAGWELYAAAGTAARIPDATERYAVFGPAPGGWRVGNPTLDPERSYEVDLGAKGTAGPLSLDLDLFANRVEDYVLVSLLAGVPTPDGAPLKGFHNLDHALLWGGEASLAYALTDTWQVSGRVGYTEGVNGETHGPLPEIAPLAGRVEVRYDDPEGRFWAAAGSDWAAPQSRADAAFGEDDTPGYAVFDAGFGWRVRPGLKLTCRVENLFDRTYHRHLTREALAPVGDLAPGDEVPEPGVAALVTLAARF